MRKIAIFTFFLLGVLLPFGLKFALPVDHVSTKLEVLWLSDFE